MLARGDVGPAFDSFAKATAMRPENLARAHLKARNFGFAETKAREAVAKNPKQVAPLASQVEILHLCGKDKEAREAYRSLELLARSADRDLPVMRRVEAIVSRWKAENAWAPSAEPHGSNGVGSGGTDETAVNRIDLTTLGPLTWSPFPAEPFSRTDTTGASWKLADQHGKNVLIIFFLGGKCAHCMQQLELFGKEIEALKKLNVELVAIGTDDLEAARVPQEQQGRHQVPDADPGRPRARAVQALSGL